MRNRSRTWVQWPGVTAMRSCFRVIIAMMLFTTCLAQSETATALKIQPLNRIFLNLYNVLDTDAVRSIPNVTTYILAPRGNRADMTQDLLTCFAASYVPNTAAAECGVFAPPEKAFWGCFDSRRKPVFLLTLYLHDSFTVRGLAEVGDGFYQPVSNGLWNGSFNSRLLVTNLLMLSGDRILTNDTRRNRASVP